MRRNLIVSILVAGAMTLPSIASAQGQGPGPGAGMGQGKGMGSGQGMGPGQGAGQGMGPGQGAGPGMQQQRWTRERMFGTRLMTLDERQAHMQKMWNAKTVEERTKIRDEHRKLMLDRAKQQKQTIDDKQDDTYTLPERG